MACFEAYEVCQPEKDLSCLKCFLKYYDINARHLQGKTLLHFAVCCENIPFIEYLLHMEADTEIEDDNGHTSLGIAIGRDYETTISIFTSLPVGVIKPAKQ